MQAFGIQGSGFNVGAEIITNTILGFLIINIVYWAPKPYSNY